MKATEALRSFDDCMFWNRISLSALGLWPLDQDVTTKRLHHGLMYFSLCSILIPQWNDLYNLRGNMEASIDTILSNIFIMGVIIKFYNFIKWTAVFKVWLRQLYTFVFLLMKFQEILEKMRRDWIDVMTGNSEEKKVILKELSSKARSYSFKYVIVICFSGTMYAISPFMINDVNRVRKYPFFGKYHFDKNSNWAYYFFFFGQVRFIFTKLKLS